MFLSVGIGVFVVVALVFLSVGIGVCVVAALAFLWVAELGFAELSAPAPLFFSRRKSASYAEKPKNAGARTRSQMLDIFQADVSSWPSKFSFFSAILGQCS